MIDRTAVRLAYRSDENETVRQRLAQAKLTGPQQGEASAIARTLVKAVRGHKAAGLDAFLQAYDLGSDEGIALMCLAEALLRIPDAETADELIADKLSGPDWAEKLGDSRSTFVNAATFSLLLTGRVLEEANDKSDSWRAALGRAVGRLGEPVIRTAVSQAMKILGRQFVFGRTIDEALSRAAPEQAKGWSHSFDMLGEAAKTHADAARYARAYAGALDTIAKAAKGGFRKAPGISVKLSALHPRYEWSHAEEAGAAILPVLRDLALKASKADVHFTIDAEEADRLELSMDLIEAAGRGRSTVRQRMGRLRTGHPGIFEARGAAGRLDGRAGAQAWPQADGPAGQGRLLGQRDQGRPGRRPGRLSGVHPQGRDRRLLPRLCQADARCQRLHLFRLRYP